MLANTLASSGAGGGDYLADLRAVRWLPNACCPDAYGRCVSGSDISQALAAKEGCGGRRAGSWYSSPQSRVSPSAQIRTEATVHSDARRRESGRCFRRHRTRPLGAGRTTNAIAPARQGRRHLSLSTEGRPAVRRERDSASGGVQRGVTVRPSLRWRRSWSVCLHPNSMGQHRRKCRAAGGRGWASDHVVRRHVRAPTLRIRV